MPNTSDLIANRALEASAACQEHLADQGVITQGAILADLVAMWLAGQFVREEIGKAEHPITDELRRRAFDQWCDTVRKLVSPSEQQLLTRADAKGRA